VPDFDKLQKCLDRYSVNQVLKQSNAASLGGKASASSMEASSMVPDAREQALPLHSRAEGTQMLNPRCRQSRFLPAGRCLRAVAYRGAAKVCTVLNRHTLRICSCNGSPSGAFFEAPALAAARVRPMSLIPRVSHTRASAPLGATIASPWS